MMTQEALQLKIPGPRFGSYLDEKAFFDWIERISGVESIRGEKSEINVVVNMSKFDDNSLRQMLSLYHRYNLNFEGLHVFINKDNQEWVLRPTAYWADRLGKLHT